MLKLSYGLEYSGCKNVEEALRYVRKFENTQMNRIKNGLFFRPKKMLDLACRDAEDVVRAMKRYEGVGAENWNCFGDNWEVNSGRTHA